MEFREKCCECPHFAKFANTDECGLGLCMIRYTEVAVDGECIYKPEPYTCGDCQHFVENDTACMTVEANESTAGCGGFIDAKYPQLVGILTDWLIRGKDCVEEFNNALKEAQAFISEIKY